VPGGCGGGGGEPAPLPHHRPRRPGEPGGRAGSPAEQAGAPGAPGGGGRVRRQQAARIQQEAGVRGASRRSQVI
jgi:hypothetical protein